MRMRVDHSDLARPWAVALLALAVSGVGCSSKYGIDYVSTETGAASSSFVTDAQFGKDTGKSAGKDAGKGKDSGLSKDMVASDAPVPDVGATDDGGESGGLRQVATQTLPDRHHPLATKVRPDLQGAKATAERDAPVAQVADLTVDRRLQVRRVRAHHLHEVICVTHVIQRRVEGDPKPLVGIDHE